jgi:hypothetical protein
VYIYKRSTEVAYSLYYGWCGAPAVCLCVSVNIPWWYIDGTLLKQAIYSLNATFSS